METTIKYKRYTIEIVADEYAQSPDEWGNDDAFIIYDHRDFFVERKGFDGQEIFDRLQAGKLIQDGYHIFPLYAYIHSGVSLALSRSGDGKYWQHAAWDTSFKGFVLVKRSKGWSYRRDKAEKVAQSIVNEWNDYLSGNVYGFRVLDPEGELIESAWGFYGNPEESGIIDEAKASADHDIRERANKHGARVKAWIINKVNLLNRSPLFA